MRRRVEPPTSRLREQRGEGLGREAILGATEADGDDLRHALRRLEHHPGELERQVPVQAGDEPHGDVALSRRGLDGLPETVVRPPAGHELQLRVPDARAGGVLAVLAHESRVIAGLHHRRPGRRDRVDEAVQVVEGARHDITAAVTELVERRGADAALEVHVDLGLRQRREVGRDPPVVHGVRTLPCRTR